MPFERGFNLGDTEGCCGVIQIKDFSEDVSEDEWGSYREVRVTGKTLQSTYKKMFKEFDDLDKGYIYQIWFVKKQRYDGGFEEDFEAEELRQLVMGIPNVRSLGSTTNPNSGNIIEGYQWIA